MSKVPLAVYIKGEPHLLVPEHWKTHRYQFRHQPGDQTIKVSQAQMVLMLQNGDVAVGPLDDQQIDKRFPVKTEQALKHALKLQPGKRLRRRGGSKEGLIRAAKLAAPHVQLSHEGLSSARKELEAAMANCKAKLDAPAAPVADDSPFGSAADLERELNSLLAHRYPDYCSGKSAFISDSDRARKSRLKEKA